ncbi:MAG: DUF2029 domain-containing protein, partial [Ardenticatenia bacterium]|nr:DUF2029 domain-containing protein [Ardenticatenia bacterium]
YSRWRGAQVYWLDGVDPYSEPATLAIQQGIYGRPAKPHEDPGPFAYPLFTVFLLFPLVWLPYVWAEAIWLVILQFSLVAGVFLTLSTLNWRLPPWLMALTGLWAVLFYHSARTMLLGQFAGLIFLCITGVLYALKRERNVAAGMLLALTTIKPQMSVFFIPALVLWAIGQRRWQFLMATAATMALLMGASFALLPSWLAQFVGQIARYPSYTAIGSPIWIIIHHYLPQTGLHLREPSFTLLEIGLSGLLVVYLLLQWRHLPQASVASGLFHWLIGMTFIITNLVVLRTATTNYVALYIPLLFCLKGAADRWPKGHSLLAVFYLLSTVAGWAMFTTTVEARFEHPIMYLPLPVGLFIIFIWARRPLQNAMRETVPALSQECIQHGAR